MKKDDQKDKPKYKKTLCPKCGKEFQRSYNYNVSKVISIQKLLLACKEALSEAEDRYSDWSGGTGMRHAPESFVQYVVAEKLRGCGVTLRLEELVRDLVPGNESGRIDIVVYDESKLPRLPRLLIEIKKITEVHSLYNDCNRIRTLLNKSPSLEMGVMIGYMTAKDTKIIDKRLDAVMNNTGADIFDRITPIHVNGKKSCCFLGGAVYQVDLKPSQSLKRPFQL